MRSVVGIALSCLGAVLLQWLFFGRLVMWGAYPDLVLLFVAVIALRTGRLSGALTGFAAGFMLDAIYGSWGVQMIVKTLIGFCAGLLSSGESTAMLRSPIRALMGGLSVAVVHNGILLLLITLQSGERSSHLILETWIGCSLYTGVLAFLASLVQRR